MKAVKIDSSGSVLIDTGKLKIWVDVWEENNELTADWNKYIFFLNNQDDLDIREFQSDANNFMEATELAIDFYERNF